MLLSCCLTRTWRGRNSDGGGLLDRRRLFLVTMESAEGIKRKAQTSASLVATGLSIVIVRVHSGR